MRESPEHISEIDIMAYADGLLDRDLQRKRKVEAHIAQHPGLSHRVEEIKAQNAAIREEYAAVLDAPVPDHLMAIVERRNIRPLQMWSRAAILMGLLSLSGLGGWFLGSEADRAHAPEDRLIELATREHMTSAATLLEGAGLGMQAASMPLTDLSPQISFQMVAPDLRKFGYTLIDKRQTGGTDDSIVRLVYQNAGGTLVSMLLRPRWVQETTTVKNFENNGVKIRHWLDGPIEITLVSSDSRLVGEDLARAVHDAVTQARVTDIANSRTKRDATVDIGNSVIGGDDPIALPVSDAIENPSVIKSN
jgi:anti-sigma factor RsiW